MHNIHYLLNLMRQIRAAIVEDRYPAFLRDYFYRAHRGDMSKVPAWAVTALRGVGVDLLTSSSEIAGISNVEVMDERGQ